MEDKEINKLKEAGKASAEALALAKSIIKPGKSILEAAEEIERSIKSKGFLLAFPVNLSINEKAAHFTPETDDNSVFSEKDVVKVDLGARKDTILTDCAITIDLSNKNAKLVEATNEALESAISVVKAGRQLRDIGKEIENVASKHGFKPIKNLGGHGISEADLHADFFIPNFDNGDNTELEEGQVIAIEPFLTTGRGQVEDSTFTAIFQKNSQCMTRSNEARAVSAFIDENFLTYPFATRWLSRELQELDDFKIRRGIAELINSGAIEAFPGLVEKGRGMVAQAEHSLLVQKDGCEIITK
jgi:methionyl aminopeptidase